MIKVLYVEGQPRYEFRFIKFLLERESPDAKTRRKSIDAERLLLDGDAGLRRDQDKTALCANFPPTLDELEQYDVIILGDCRSAHEARREAT